MKNLITDVPGILVGHAQDGTIATGVTAALFERATTLACAVLGGAPGTRETDLLSPEMIAPGANAVVLSGGSVFGLDAASGVQARLRETKSGFAFGGLQVPLVSQAISFDLTNGGDKDWGLHSPYRELGYAAAVSSDRDFALGTIGGGYGATTADLKGGLGSASAVASAGFRVGALVVVNAIASAVIGGGPHFWAAPFEEGEEFGGRGLPARITPAMRRLTWKGGPQTGTTIALVATDATLSKGQAKRLALSAQGGLHKALRFALAPTDGDTIFAAATGGERAPDLVEETELGALAADCLARAIARGVYEASALPFAAAKPAWRDLFGTA